MKNNQQKNQVRFRGTVVKAVYVTDNYKVYGLTVNTNKYPFIKINKYNNASICGDMPELKEGVEYEVVAREGEGKYGTSYRVSSVRRDMPKTKDGVRSFLEEITSSNVAYELSEAYPDIIDRVREHRLDDIDLSKVRGVGEKNFEKIVRSITENFHLYDLVVEFGGILTLSMIRRIYARYESVDMLKNKLRKEPYSTLTKVSGIGFDTADKIVLAMQDEGVINFGFDIRTSVDRCLACVVYILNKNEEDEGHTKANIIELRKRVADKVPMCVDKFNEAIADDSIYYNKERLEIALKKTRDEEYFIAKTVFNNISNNNVWQCDTEKYRNVDGVNLSDEQLSVIDNVCKYGISILNGPAGSGKSFSTKAIIKMLDDQGKSYRLLAPTGKAAKVLANFTGKPASTIHRGLLYSADGGFGLDRKNKIMEDIVIVDEVSMIDVWLFYHLIDAIDFSKTKLLMIGDNAQLPSVGCGNVLHDLMESKLVPTVTLSKIFRYGEGGLMKVATDVRMGRHYLDGSMKNSVTSFGTNKDYVFMDVPTEKSAQTAVAIYKSLLSKGDSINDIQVITPKKDGDCGTINLNEAIQKVANPNCGSDNFFEYNGTKYYMGDLVIECSNNYKAPLSESTMSSLELEMIELQDEAEWPTAFVANGETGVVREVGKSFIDIDFDGVVVRYNRDMMNLIKLGYAITCHKSQGSSINNVILLTPQSNIFMLNSNLLYVGCTRARNKCYHIGSVDTVNKVIKKKANLTRHTFMQQMLKELSCGESV